MKSPKGSQSITYQGLDGESYTETLRPITVSGILLHATPDSNLEQITREGLKANMPRTKLMVDVPAVFCTIPSETPSTNDLFRYYSDWSVVVIDADAIPGHSWFVDFLAEDDDSNNGQNQHVLTFEDIPAAAIRTITK